MGVEEPPQRRLGAEAPHATAERFGLVVDHDRLRREGMAAYEAILETCRERARPVVLTAVTAILGVMLALGGLLEHLGRGPQPVRLLVMPGRPAAAVQAWFENQKWLQPASNGGELLSISYLPYRTQRDYDELLWACDLNFVRGEDSLVRALWAGVPFVWNIYPQHDGVHAAKLQALLDWLEVDDEVRQLHLWWNGLSSRTPVWPDPHRWKAQLMPALQRALAQDDLVSSLLKFVAKSR